jgi:hypothetical protein
MEKAMLDYTQHPDGSVYLWDGDELVAWIAWCDIEAIEVLCHAANEKRYEVEHETNTAASAVSAA